MVPLLSPGQSTMFNNYVEPVFLPFTRKELATVVRIDFVWDKYYPESFTKYLNGKSAVGDGVRTRIVLTTKIAKNLPNFLHTSANKEELFSLVVTSLSEEGKEVYILRATH